MLKSILVGLDGSAYSHSAVELGIQWAKKFDALLVGLGVVDPSVSGSEAVPMGGGAYKHRRNESRMHEARVKVEEFLHEFAVRCSAAQVASKLLEDIGLPWEQILIEAQRYDLILLGQQTYFDTGSPDSPCETLHKVLKNTPRPVVTAPEQVTENGTVVVAYDGSLQAARALQAFNASGLYADQEIHIVSVGEDHVATARHTDRAAEFLRFHQVPAQAHVLTPSGSAADTILEQVKQHRAALLVMGAYGQPFLREFILGSCTQTLIKQAPVPMFLYH